VEKAADKVKGVSERQQGVLVFQKRLQIAIKKQ